MLGAHSIDHYCLTVPDLDEAGAFYTQFGLDARSDGEALELYAPGNRHRWARYYAGRQKKLDYVSFGIYAGDVDAFRAHLADHRIACETPSVNAVDDTGIWLRDPDGTLLELRVAEKVSPNAKSPVEFVSSPVGVSGAPLREKAPRVHPRRLSHVLIFSTDIARSIEWYGVTVGLKLSDAAGDVVAFMHAQHGSDHHVLAFAKSDAGGFHHASWDVGSVNDVGLGAMQMADAGHRRGWGLGRHVLGSNYFHYVRDPWGSYCEYSHDIDYVPGDGSWRASHVSPENGFYLWGPQPPDDFAFNYESPAAELQREMAQ
jgi:catechol 2,3-dioxygenase-like lactoylglutathione lyase family enzyme